MRPWGKKKRGERREIANKKIPERASEREKRNFKGLLSLGERLMASFSLFIHYGEPRKAIKTFFSFPHFLRGLYQRHQAVSEGKGFARAVSEL